MVQEVVALESTFLTDGSSFLPMLRILRWVDSIDLVKKSVKSLCLVESKNRITHVQ